MKIKELIKAVAKLVSERDTIDHGSIRCLWSQNAVNEIHSVEDCDEVDTGTVGDDDLAEKLNDLADGDQIGEIEWESLEKLERQYRSDDIADYLQGEKEDELAHLDDLIEAAREIV